MQTELALKLGIESPTLVRLLDLLEKKEWIRRVILPDDRRRKYCVLTSKAKEQIVIIDKISRHLRDRMMAGIPGAEINAALSVMDRIRDNLTRE